MTLDIPINERYPNLRAALLHFAENLAAALNSQPDLLKGTPSDAFWVLALPWLVEAEAPKPLDQNLLRMINGRKAEIARTGFDGLNTAIELQKIRGGDQHLAECCPTLVHLARHFSKNFLYDAAAIIESGADQDAITKLYAEFERLTYGQGRFRRSAFTHVFNLDIEGNEIQLDGLRIVRLNPDFKTLVLGEPSPNPFLHPPGLGDCFVFANEGPSDLSDDAWLDAKRAEASELVAVLQYFKPGLVHVGYTAPGFFPPWAHQIRRFGLYFLGEPRRTPHNRGENMYRIEAAEIDSIRRYWTAIRSPKIAAAINDRSSKLRQAVLRAGEYYEKSHAALGSPERLIYLAIALEALFSPDNQEQLRFRISHAAAQFLGDNAIEKQVLFERAQELYKRRSSIVHGGYDVHKYMAGTLISQDELHEWSDLIRRAVLGFFILGLRGETDRRRILEQLERAAFDESLALEIKRKCDIEDFLKEFDF